MLKQLGLLWGALLLFLSSCSTISNQDWQPSKNQVTQAMHQQVMEELQTSQRSPASVINELGIRLKDLNKLRPAKFETYVFPKINNQNHKELAVNDEYLGPPQVFEITIMAVNPCKMFIQSRLFASLKPKEVFPAELAQNSSRYCAILEVTNKKLRTINKALLRQDDQLSVRLFVDDQYVVHGIDHVIFESTNVHRVVRRLANEAELGSGLGQFPIDLPREKAGVQPDQVEKSFSKLLDPIARHQIKKRHARQFEAPQCRGAIVSYRDELGSLVKIGQCQDFPWPSYIETSRYFSVTQPLSLRR